MTTEEMMAVLDGLQRGERIEIKGPGLYSKWHEMVLPAHTVFHPDFARNSYRVKPAERKPREWWIYPTGETNDCGFEVGKILRNKSSLYCQ